MLCRLEINGVIDPLNHIRTVAGQQRCDVDMPLLQLLVRIELIECALELSLGSFVPSHLRSVKARAQTFKLIVNFPPPSLERIGERWIHRLEFVAQSIELAVNLRLSLIERLRRVCSQVFFNYPGQHVLQSGEQIGQSQSELVQHSTSVRFDHRQTRARQNWCNRTFKQPVHFARLREVGYFSRTTKICNRGQEIILNNCPQQNVGSEFLRMGQRAFS